MSHPKSLDSLQSYTVSCGKGSSHERLCRICHCPSSLNDNLISPCRCSGSLKYVHMSCLLVCPHFNRINLVVLCWLNEAFLSLISFDLIIKFFSLFPYWWLAKKCMNMELYLCTLSNPFFFLALVDNLLSKIKTSSQLWIMSL